MNAIVYRSDKRFLAIESHIGFILFKGDIWETRIMVFVDHKCVKATIVIVQHKHNNLSQEEIDNKECSYTYMGVYSDKFCYPLWKNSENRPF